MVNINVYPTKEEMGKNAAIKTFGLIKQIMQNKKKIQTKIKIYIPGKNFPPISLTGTHCDLNCEHCDKKYLEHMLDGSSSKKLTSILDGLIENGKNGALISGGCESNGKVPIGNFINEIRLFKEKSHLYLNSHIGITDEKSIKEIEKTNLDMVSFDLIFDQKVITEVFHSKRTIVDYQNTYLNLQKSNIRVVPHILIGAYFGKIRKELEIIQFLRQYPPDLIVFIVMIPPKVDNAIDPKFRIPLPHEVARLILITKQFLPDVEISLGCMRPREKKFRIMEKWAIQSGINRLEIPSRQTKIWMKENNLETETFHSCCAISTNYETKLRK